MGGRIVSQMVAEGQLEAGRLIFLGYPLHPPGRKERLRDRHLSAIRIPTSVIWNCSARFCHTLTLPGSWKSSRVPIIRSRYRKPRASVPTRYINASPRRFCSSWQDSNRPQRRQPLFRGLHRPSRDLARPGASCYQKGPSKIGASSDAHKHMTMTRVNRQPVTRNSLQETDHAAC